MGDTNALRSSDYAALNGNGPSGLVGKPAAVPSDIQVPTGYAPAQPPAGYAYPGSNSSIPQGTSMYSSSSLPPMMAMGANANGPGVGVGAGYAPAYLNGSSSAAIYPSAFSDLVAGGSSGSGSSQAPASNAGRFAATSNPARRQQQQQQDAEPGGNDSDAPSGADEGTSPNTGTSSGHGHVDGSGNGSTSGGNGTSAGNAGESAAAKKKREKEEKDKRLKTSRACDGCRTRKIRWVGGIPLLAARAGRSPCSAGTPG